MCVAATITLLRVESFDNFLKEVELGHRVRDLSAPQRHKRSEGEFQRSSICLNSSKKEEYTAAATAIEFEFEQISVYWYDAYMCKQQQMQNGGGALMTILTCIAPSAAPNPVGKDPGVEVCTLTYGHM